MREVWMENKWSLNFIAIYRSFNRFTFCCDCVIYHQRLLISKDICVNYKNTLAFCIDDIGALGFRSVSLVQLEISFPCWLPVTSRTEWHIFRVHPQLRVCFTILYWNVILGFTSGKKKFLFLLQGHWQCSHKVRASVNGTLPWSNNTQSLNLFVFQTSHNWLSPEAIHALY